MNSERRWNVVARISRELIEWKRSRMMHAYARKINRPKTKYFQLSLAHHQYIEKLSQCCIQFPSTLTCLSDNQVQPAFHLHQTSNIDGLSYTREGMENYLCKFRSQLISSPARQMISIQIGTGRERESSLTTVVICSIIMAPHESRIDFLHCLRQSQISQRFRIIWQ